MRIFGAVVSRVWVAAVVLVLAYLWVRTIAGWFR